MKSSCLWHSHLGPDFVDAVRGGAALARLLEPAAAPVRRPPRAPRRPHDLLHGRRGRGRGGQERERQQE